MCLVFSPEMLRGLWRLSGDRNTQVDHDRSSRPRFTHNLSVFLLLSVRRKGSEGALPKVDLRKRNKS